MGIFDKKEEPKADFSNVQSGSSSTAPDVGRQHARPAETKRYTVRPGDSLSAIAKREYGDAAKWHQIFDANRDQISDPDMIQPGQELTIPPEGGSR